MKVIHREPYEYQIHRGVVYTAEMTSDEMGQDGLKDVVNTDSTIIVPDDIEGYPVTAVHIQSQFDGERRIVLPKHIERATVFYQKLSSFEYPETKDVPETGDEYAKGITKIYLWQCSGKELHLHSSDWFVVVAGCQFETLFLEKRFTTIRRTDVGAKKQQNKIKHLVIDAPNLEYLEGFIEMESLESVEIRRGVKEIRKGAFRGCKNLKNVTISPTVHSVGRLAFTDCHPDLQLEWRQNEQQPLEDFLDF